MKLISLTINSMPGIEGPVHLENPGPGINLICAPNGSGKSSLIRALAYLIRPVRDSDPVLLSLSAEFSDEKVRYKVSRLGRACTWEKNGSACLPPPLPDSDQLGSYWFSVEDLLRSGQQDASLVREIRKALTGGYDMESLASQTPFQVSPRHGQTAVRSLKEAEKKFRAAGQSYERLRQEEARLPELEQQTEKASRAEARALILEQALALTESRQQRVLAEQKLSEFPGSMQRLRGDEEETAEKILCEKAITEAEINRLQSRLRCLEEEQAALFPGSACCPSGPELAQAESWLNELTQSTQKMALVCQRLEKAGKERDLCESQLAGFSHPLTAPGLSPEAIAGAEGLVLSMHQARLRVSELEVRQSMSPGTAEPRPDAATTSKGLHALNTWLQQQGAGWLSPATLSLAALVLTGMLALYAGSWLLFLTAAFTGSGISLTLLQSLRSRNRARDAYRQTGLEEPDSWTSAGILRQTESLQKAAALWHQWNTEKIREHNIPVRLRAAEEKVQKLAGEGREFCLKHGFDPLQGDAGLSRLLRLADSWHRCSVQILELEAEKNTLADDTDCKSVALNSLLASAGAAPAASDSPEAMIRALCLLKERAAAAAECRHKIRETQKELATAESQAGSLRSGEELLYQRCAIAVGDASGLRHLSRLREEWLICRDSLHSALTREKDCALGEKVPAEIEALVRKGHTEDLRSRLSKAREEAASFVSLREEYAGIKRALSDAGKDFRAEQALQNLDSCKAECNGAWEAQLFSEASGLLLDSVREEYQSLHQPEVLKGARERFARFTAHLMDLSVDAKKGLMATDRQKQLTLAPEQLSSGTRMQLLLALRLSWASHLERTSRPLPLFLDEALTTSDETRFTLVVRCLEQLAREEGRQIFYLSAREQESLAWQHIVGSEVHLCDLPGAVKNRHFVTPESLDFLKRQDIPAPGNLSYSEYGVKLAVPAPDPAEPAGHLHLYWLLSGHKQLLYRLLSVAEISTLGQLEGYLDHKEPLKSVFSDSETELLRIRGAAARSWMLLKQQGCCLRVDQPAIAASGAVSPAFLTQVSELADSLGGDGRKLIRALENRQIRGFRQNKTDQLAAWFTGNNYISERPQLSRGERLRHILASPATDMPPEETVAMVSFLEKGSALSRVTDSQH